MATLPEKQKALKVVGSGQLELDLSCQIPELEEDEVLVHVKCVAVNPVDAKLLDMAPHADAVAGCEFAGDVVKIGSKVKNVHIVGGTRVFGCVMGNHPERGSNGAFAEFVAVPGDLLFLLPSHFSYQQGASLGTALPTVGLAVYRGLKLPLPQFRPEEAHANRATNESDTKQANGDTGGKEYVLVYGGSTSSGTMAIQMIRKSGFIPICTCSPRSFDLVKTAGAEKAFDYHSLSCGDDIRKYTTDSLAHVLDCITDNSSVRICYQAVGAKGGKYIGLNPIPSRAISRRDIKPDYVLVYTMFGKAVRLPMPFARTAKPKDREFAEKWYSTAQKFVDAPGAITLHPMEKYPGGLGAVASGLDRLRKGEVTGVKLVYDVV